MLNLLLSTWLVFAQAPERTTDTSIEFSVLGMTCHLCSGEATKALRKISAVKEAEVDLQSEKAVLRTRKEISREQIRRALKPLGLEARFPGDPVIQPLTDAEKVGLDIRTISRGEAVRIEEHLAAGKITIIDYFADWCGPCHLLSPKLERLVLHDPNLAIRKVDISDWESEAAKQATREFQLPGLPYVRIYSASGRHVGDVHGNDLDKIQEIIRKLK